MNLRIATLYIFSLALSCNVFASLTVEQAQAALDFDPTSGFSVTGILPLALDNDSLSGGKSLALTYTAEKPSGYLSFIINGSVEQNSVIEFHLKKRAIPDFDLSAKLEGYSLDTRVEPADQQGWQKVVIPIATNSYQKIALTFGMPASESANAALLVDQFTITPGNLLTLTPNRAGSLVPTPQKNAYANGDIVTIAAQPNDGFRLSKIVLSSDYIRTRFPIRPFYRETKTGSISHLISYHTNVNAVYDAAIACIGGQAWSIGDPAALSDPTSPLEDNIQMVSVEGLTQPGVLAFEALATRARSIDFTPEAGLFGQSKTFQIVRDEENFVPIHVAFETAPQTIRMGAEYTNALKIRNLRYITEPVAFLSKIGLGNVTVDYQTTLEGQTSATLKATPAEGWIFLGWRSEQYGDFLEKEPRFTIALQHARTFHAVFGQSLEADGRALAFVHSGEATITIQDSEPGHTAYSVSSSPNHTGYDPDYPIELYIFDLPAGSLQRNNYNGFDIQTYTSSAFANPFRLPGLLVPAYYEPTQFSFNITPLADLSPTIKIIAPANSVDATPAPYSYGQTVALNLKPAFHSRFVGWRGDLFSDKPETTVSATNNKTIAAVSEYDIPFDSPIAMKWLSPHLPSGNITNNTFQATINGSFESILSGYVDGPCILKFIRIGTGNAAPTRIILPNQQPGESYQLYPYVSGSEIRIPIVSAGNFSITFSGSETPELFSLKFAGVYQRIEKSYLPQGGSITMNESGNGDFLVGSSTQFSFVPEEGFALLGWSEPELPASATSTTLELYKHIQLTPKVTFDSRSSQVTIPSSNLDSWTYVSYKKRLESKQSFAAGEFLSFPFLVEGPGVLTLTIPDDQDIDVYSQGILLHPVSRFGDQPYTRNFEYLLPAGDSQVELEIWQLKNASYPDPIPLYPIHFAPGYAIRRKSSALGDLTLTPANTNDTYPPGTSVTLNAVTRFGNAFQKWTGDATGSNSSTQVVMDQHRIVAPTYTPTTNISPASYSVSANANTLAYTFEGSTAFDIAGSTEPAVFTFTIPAKYEFKFNLSGTFSESATWTVNGESPREIYPDSVIATAPANNQRTATLRVKIDPRSSEVLHLTNLQTRNTFLLGGFFGANTSNVLVDPSRESYGWGVKVKIRLDSSIPSSSRFYDLAIEYEGYEKIDWSSPDFVREFQVEILGDTYLAGKIGPSFTRANGQITSYPEEANRASNVLDPLNRSSRELDPNAVHRIQTGGAHFLTFFLKVPAEDYVVLDSLSGGNPIPIEGTGEWMQVGMPVPAGRTFAYFNLVDNGGVYNEPSYIAGIKTITGYAPPFISFGPGQITVEPATGSATPSGNVTLRAQPNISTISHLWLTPYESDESTIVAQANETLPIFAYFEEPDTEEAIPTLPFNLAAIGTVPEFINQTDPTPNQRITFRTEPINLVLPVHGPSTLVVDAHITPQSNLELEIGSRRFDVTKPDYNGTIASYYPIPAGVTEVRLNYTSDAEYTTSNLYNLQEVDAFIVEAGSSNATVALYPVKPYYQAGDIVTLFASPNDGFTFNSWSGTSSSNSNPLQFTISGHASFNARLEEKTITNSGNQTWRPIPFENGAYSYETIVQGPGTVFLELNHKSGANLRIDGLPTAIHPTWPNNSYFLVPTGKHRLRLTQPQPLSQAPVRYVSGFHIDLTPLSINHSLKVSPQRTSYHAGDQVTIDWPESIVIQDPNRPVLLEPFGTTASLPYTFTVQDHVVGQAYALLPTAAENLLASNMYELSNYTDTVSDLTGKNLYEGLNVSFDHSALHLKLTQGGTLRFNYGRESYYQNLAGSVSLNGQYLQDVENGKSYQLNIPSSGGLITWNTTSTDPWSYGNSSLNTLSFTPNAQPDSFTATLEKQAPTTTFVTSSAIGPNDDLDGDGSTNLFEIDRGTNPGVFDLWIWTSEGDETPSKTLARFNKLKSPANKIQTLPSACLELTLANPAEFPLTSTSPSLYALTILPANIPIETLSIQLGNTDPETGQILWTSRPLAPPSSPISITPTPRLIRLEINDLTEHFPLLRFVKTD